MALNSVPSIHNIIPTTKKISWVHYWEPKTKIISCTIAIFALVFLDTPILLGLSFAILAMMVISMGVSVKQFATRLMLFLPFLIFLSIPILIGGGLPPTEERITLALLLNLKGLNSLSMMFILFFSQPTPKLLGGLADLKLPSSFISIIFLSWRYIFIIIERVSRLFKSLKSRLFQAKFQKGSLKVYGEVMGGMLIRSIDTSDKVYKAMSSRGFDGAIPTTPTGEIVTWDIIKSILVIGGVILLHIIERWWF